MGWFGRLLGEKHDEALPLYTAVVQRARAEHWYRDGQVPDTVDGRFDMIAAVLALVMLRMESEPSGGEPAARLAERFVDDMDGQLRELGIGDIIVGKHIGRMMSMLGGRLGAYRDGLAIGRTFAGTREEPYAYERIEVLKGASSSGFGAAEPGGSVNYVTKTPKRERFGEVYGTGGSFQHKEFGFDFGDKADLGTLTPFWTHPTTSAQLCENGSSYIVRERDGEGWKQTFRIGRLMCQKPITRENAIQLIGDGKTELIKGFISKKGRPFDAFLKREGPKFSWEFPPRAPKLDKDGKPIARKAKAPPDLSKGTVLGKSKQHKDGEIVETAEAYYVRRPDQDNRIVFTLKKELCGKQLPADEIVKLFETGRTELIPGFMSKRGMPFGAYLVLSKTGSKAEFEFPPR